MFDQYIDNLYTELNRFIIQSNLAELGVRLQYIDSFSKQIYLESSLGFTENRLPQEKRVRIANLLSNIYSYYIQFQKIIVLPFISSAKIPIEAKLRDLVNLSK